MDNRSGTAPYELTAAQVIDLASMGSDTTKRDQALRAILGCCESSMAVNGENRRCQHYAGHRGMHYHVERDRLSASWTDEALRFSTVDLATHSDEFREGA